jgi:EmrB/QacA subfamily drug resistance transporter
LAVVATAQLTVVIDLTIVNVALPDAQRALHISDGNRQWVVTAYALAFGSLLLLGGRVADYWGRKRTLILGLSGFAVASALGGLAMNGAELFTARAAQGIFGALLAPAALAILQVQYPTGPERTRAFAVFGAIAGGGAAFGSVLGGILTEYASWRWCLLVNVPVVVIASVAAVLLLPESRTQGSTRYDVPGILSATAGICAIVYGFTRAGSSGWNSPVTLALIFSGVTLLVVFVQVERVSDCPLLPLRVVLHRTRGGSFLTAFLAGAALLGVLLFLTFYMQNTLGYSPLKSGLLSLPTTAVFVVGTRICEKLTNRFGGPRLIVTGAFIAAIGVGLLTRISPSRSFGWTVIPGQVILGVGLCALFIPLSSTALVDVSDDDAGAASGMLSATQQVGSAVGIALFSSIYASAAGSYLSSHGATSEVGRAAAIHGYVVAFWWAALALVAAAITALVTIRMPSSAAESSSEPSVETFHL